MAREYKCPFCGQTIRTFFNFRNHIFANHKSDNIKCPYCNFKANTWNDFAIHILMTKEDNHDFLLKVLLNEYKEIQDKSNTSQSKIKNNNENLKMRKRNLTSDIYFICPYCNEKYDTFSNLRNHIFEKHLSGNNYCPFCKLNFESSILLLSHLWNTNDIEHLYLYYIITDNYRKFIKLKINNKCPFCNSEFSNIINLYRHVLFNHNNNSIKCPYCNYKTDNLKDLRNHAQNQIDISHLFLNKMLTNAFKLNNDLIN